MMPAEFDIIAHHFAPLAGPGGLGLLDDAALVRPSPGHDLVVTTDAIVAGVHFFADDPPDTIAKKALGVNLSDLAAKGADPIGFVLSLVLPRGVEEEWLAAFAQGLGEMAVVSGCALLGGDTVIAPGPLTLSITALGSVPEGRMVKRGGARAGDRLFVTGTIGDAALGLKARLDARDGKRWYLTEDHLAFLEDRYLVPHPRNTMAKALRQHAHAAMDVSDGFVGDLTKMLALAGFGADIQLDEVPISVAARAAIRRDPAVLETALTGGDDYEVLAAVPADRAVAFLTECLAVGVQVTEIGVVGDKEQRVRFLAGDGQEKTFTTASYVHGAN
jgi:thiamine-monophosphate kinase